MEGSVLAYVLVFAFFAAMEVTGMVPQEVRRAGLTFTALFSPYYGDEGIDFVRYHMRRTALVTVLHTSLPLFFCLGLHLVSPELKFPPWHYSNPSFLPFAWGLSGLVLACGVSVYCYWSRDGFKRHPLSLLLSRYGRLWSSVATSVNLEFRDMEKFLSNLGGNCLIVTDSWIIYCQTHSVHLIHQRDAVLHVMEADEHHLTEEGHSSQYLRIRVNSINRRIKSFTVRVRSNEYKALYEKVDSPIRVARSVVIQQTIGDRFASTFKEQVERNGLYHLPEGSQELEPCIGCLQTMPQVKLQKMCAELEEGSCRQCYCRPQWCVSCMAKWFASRQDRHRPDTWMGSTASCPMCRAPFCMLDVLKLAPQA